MKIVRKGGEWYARKIQWRVGIAKRLLLLGSPTLVLGVLSLVTVSSLEIDGPAFRIIATTLMLIGIAAAAFSLILYVTSWSYSTGRAGERVLTDSLEKLSDDYHLINDLYLPETYGNIDHIVIGPNGIFVIETKHHSGRIRCDGDEWQREYPAGLDFTIRGRLRWKSSKSYPTSSPSKQAKRNAMTLRAVLANRFGYAPWIEAIVVFSNPAVELEVNNPTVPVLSPERVAAFISSRRNNSEISKQTIEAMIRELAKRADPGPEKVGT